MCEICNNNSIRNYTHSKNKHHLRLLLKIMKDKKNTGYYLIAYEERAKTRPDIM